MAVKIDYCAYGLRNVVKKKEEKRVEVPYDFYVRA